MKINFDWPDNTPSPSNVNIFPALFSSGDEAHKLRQGFTAQPTDGK
jgi:hypothetical protein